MIGSAALLAAEFLVLMFRFTTASLAGASEEWANIVSRSTVVPQLALVGATGVALFSSHVLERELLGLRVKCFARTGRIRMLALQLTCFALLFAATRQVFEEHARDETAPWGWIALWTMAATGTIVGGTGLFLSLRDLLALVRRSAGALCIAPALGVAAWGIGVLGAEILQPALRVATLWLSRSLLQLFTNDLFVDVPEFVFGTSTFAIRIAPQCSGLEGIGLTFAFTASYLWISRDSLRFPHALLIPLLGILAAWVFNSVRLASLVAVGSWISPAVAVDGFHTLAGLTAFCGISWGLVWWTQRSDYFRRNTCTPSSTEASRSLTLALLGPFLAFVGCGVLLDVLGGGQVRWYPLQPFAAVGALLLLRRSYPRPTAFSPWLGIATGIVAFMVWTLFAPHAGAGSSAIDPASELAGMNAWTRSLWVVARVLGYGLITPLIEELAFRSYLLRRLTSRDFENVPLTGFSWTALLASSLVFGALHESWPRAMLAGLIYGLVLRRRGRVGDAVVAHVTTNVLLLIQAFAAQDWAMLE